jgi:hypothetical protein
VTITRKFAAAAAFTLLALPAAATEVFVDGESGYGARLIGLGLALPGHDALWRGDGWQVDHQWWMRLANWHARNDAATDKDVWDVGVVPVLRLRSSAASSVIPFAEAGIGAHLISRTRLDDRKFSTAFQFGEHVAVGARFGAYTAALRLEHVSNGSIKRPNSGMTFTGVELRYDWR